MAQNARPTSLISNGAGWSFTGGALSLVSAIGEGVINDTSYDVEDKSTNDTFEVLLSTITDPLVSTGHVVRFRYRKDATGGNSRNLTVGLYQGATLIASGLATPSLATFSDGSFTLTGTQADSITDYSDLRLRFTGGGTVSGSQSVRREIHVSYATLETPDAAAPITRTLTPVSAAVKVTSTRAVGTSAAVKTTNTRVLGASASVSLGSSTRTLGATAAVSVSGITRTLGASASISVSGGGGGASAPTVVGTPTNGSDASATNNFTVTLPTSRAVDEYGLIGVGSSGGSINTPSGWTAITPNADIANPHIYAFYRKFDGTEADTVSMTRGASGTQNLGWVAVRIDGADATTFLDVAAVNFSDALSTATSLAMNITTTSDQALLVGLVSLNSGSTAITPPASWTEHTESTAGRVIEIASLEQATAGASGTHTWTWASGRATSGVIIAIRPAAPSGISRSVAATAAIQTTETRAVAATASIDSLGGTRVVAATASISAGVTISGTGQGHWRWYTDATPDGSMSALAAEDTTPTLTGAQVMGGIIRLRTQLFDTGNISALNAEYSVDGTNWNDVADLTPNSTTVNRWIRFVNGAATASGTLGSLLLQQSTAAGKYHEDLGIAETVGSGAVIEIDLALKPIWPPPDTTVLIRLLDGSTPIALATGATQISFTTCAPSDRLYTIDKASPSTSGGQNREMNHSQWSRLHFDGTDWWFFGIQPDDGTNLSYWRWPNGSGAWGSRQTVSMTVNAATTSEADVKHNTAFAVISGTHVVGALFAPSGGTDPMHYRRGRFTGGAVTWNADTSTGQARYNAHSHVAIDDGGYHWIGGINGSSGVWAVRSTAADDGSSGYAPDFGTISTRRKTVADATVAAGNLFALLNIGSDKVLALWNTGSTLKAAICSDASGFGSVVTVNSTASAHPADWGITRIGDTVYVVHSDNTTTGGTWRTRLYTISTDTWSAGTDPGAAQPTQNSNADGLVLSNDGTNVYAFGTTIGTEGGQDRTVTAIKWDGAAWSNLGLITPAGGRGNGDDIAGADVSGNGQLPVAYLMNDNDVNGFPFTYEVHTLALATTSSRAVAATAAISTTSTRAVGATAAISTAGNTRVLGASAAISTTQANSLAATAAISETPSRSLGATAAISTSANGRTLGTTAAISTSANTRVLGATAAISTSANGRALTATAAILETLSRALAASAAVSTTNTQVVAASASISLPGGVQSRALGATAAISTTNERSTAATAAISTVSTRSLATTAAIQTTTERALGTSAAISETLTNTLGATAAIQVTSTNSVAVTASISTPGGTQTRAVGATASIGFTNRVVDSSANPVITTVSEPVFVTSFALTSARTLGATAAIQVTNQRVLGAQAAITTTQTRVLAATASIQAAGQARVVSATAAIETTLSRALAATVAISTVNNRNLGASAVIQTTETRSLAASAAISTTVTRNLGAAAAISSTENRSVGATAALQATETRTLGATAAILTTLDRTLAATASVSEPGQRAVSTTAAVSTTNTRTLAASAVVSTGDAPRFGGLIRTPAVEPIAISRVASADPLAATRDAGVVDVLAATRDAGVVDVLAATRQATALDVAVSRQASDEPLAVARTNGPDPLSATRTAGEL